MTNLDLAFHPARPLPPMLIARDKFGPQQVAYPPGTSMLDEYAMALAPCVNPGADAFGGDMDKWADEVWALSLALLARRPTDKEVKALDGATDEKPRIALVNGDH